MDYVSTKEYAVAHDVAERTVRNYCIQGKIAGAQLVGKTWNVPADAPLPQRKNAKIKSVLSQYIPFRTAMAESGA